MQEVLNEAEELRAKLTQAVDVDAASFEAIMAAFKLSKRTEEEKTSRSQKIQEATLYASQVPLQTARDAVRVMDLALQVARMGNTNAITDGASGAAMARAALTSAGYNVRINLSSLKDKAQADVLLMELKALEARAAELDAAVKEVLIERGGLSL